MQDRLRARWQAAKDADAKAAKPGQQRPPPQQPVPPAGPQDAGAGEGALGGGMGDWLSEQVAADPIGEDAGIDLGASPAEASPPTPPRTPPAKEPATPAEKPPPPAPPSQPVPTPAPAPAAVPPAPSVAPSPTAPARKPAAAPRPQHQQPQQPPPQQQPPSRVGGGTVETKFGGGPLPTDTVQYMNLDAALDLGAQEAFVGAAMGECRPFAAFVPVNAMTRKPAEMDKPLGQVFEEALAAAEKLGQPASDVKNLAFFLVPRPKPRPSAAALSWAQLAAFLSVSDVQLKDANAGNAALHDALAKAAQDASASASPPPQGLLPRGPQASGAGTLAAATGVSRVAVDEAVGSSSGGAAAAAAATAVGSPTRMLRRAGAVQALPGGVFGGVAVDTTVPQAGPGATDVMAAIRLHASSRSPNASFAPDAPPDDAVVSAPAAITAIASSGLTRADPHTKVSFPPTAAVWLPQCLPMGASLREYAVRLKVTPAVLREANPHFPSSQVTPYEHPGAVVALPHSVLLDAARPAPGVVGAVAAKNAAAKLRPRPKGKAAAAL